MRLGRWVLALAAVSLLFCGTANAQIEANELCLHNGGEYYVNGGFFGFPNHGGGRYFPEFTHTPQVKNQDNGLYTWQLGGWFFVGMQANAHGAQWYWEVCLQISADAEASGTFNMSFDHPQRFCMGLIPHTGFPMPIYGGTLPTSLPTIGGQGWLFPSSAGGFDAYLNIFAIGSGSFNIPSTQPFYGWLFGWTVPCASAITVPSENAIWQFAWQKLGPNGQYLILSGNEMDCLGQSGLGNKARNYSVISDFDNGYLWYWTNTCNGAGQEYAMCLWVCDCVILCQNVPGATNAANPYAAYGFDVGTGAITPYMTSGAMLLGWVVIQWDEECNVYVIIGAFHSNIHVEYKGNKYRIVFDFLTNFMIGIGFQVPHIFFPYPAYWGDTAGGHTFALPVPPDPALKCARIIWTGINPIGLKPTGGFEQTWF
jgi:hypothetical protein